MVLSALPFWNASIFTKLIGLKSTVCSDWPANQCVVIGRIPQACDGNVTPYLYHIWKHTASPRHARRKFRRQYVNMIDTTWGRIHFYACKKKKSVCNDLNSCQTWDMMPFGHLFYWYSLEGNYSLYSSWSIASSIFKERPTLGFDCSGCSSVGSFLIGTGFRLYRLSPSQCCHYVQLLWWPQVLGLSRFIRIADKLLFVNFSLSLTHKYMW